MNYSIKHVLILSLFILATGKASAQASNFGVNLAGLEFGPTTLPGKAGVNYFVPTAAELDYYQSKGLSLIRIPFLWERIQPTLGGDLDPTYLTIIDGIVANASSRNMSIILDLHNYGRYPEGGKVIGSTGGPTVDNFKDVWTKLATHYANEPAVWAFDLMNEPHNLASISWFTIAQAGIDGIRTIDNSHVILVEGDNWSKGSTWTQYNANLVNLNDPADNLVFEAHQYFDNDQSGQYKNNNVTVAGAGANANTGVAYITPFVNWLNTNNLKGIVGEYGVPNNSDLANWNTLLNNFLTYLQQNCVGGTYWAGGPSWGTYITSIEPTKSGSTYIDSPQMTILESFSSLPSGCASSSNNITIAITSPFKGTAFKKGDVITITADATAVTGTITEVNFYANDVLIGTSTSSPYTITVNNLTAGTYTLKATATTDQNEKATSKGISIYVAQPVYSITDIPVIDGLSDPMWNNYPAINLNKVLIGSVSSSANLSATWKATYDNTNLYVLVDVLDSKLYNNNAAVYNNDGIEIYFDAGNSKSVSYGPKQFQYAFAWNNPTVNEYQHNATAGVTFAQTSHGITAGCTNNCSATGYTMEVKIPWSTLGITVPNLSSFEGFEVMVNDNDSGTRNAKIAWTPTTDNAWQDGSLMGTIIMDTIACTPPALAIAAQGSTLFCTGNRVTLTASTSGTAPNYQWYYAFNPINSATNATYIAAQDGKYVVTISNATCLASASIDVNVDSVTAHAGPDQHIATTSATFAATPPFTGNTGTWTIVNGTGTFADASKYNSLVSNLSPGINEFMWTIASDSCGTSNDNVIIDVGQAPSPSPISGPANVTANQTNVVYSFTPSDPNDQIVWHVPTGATIISSNTGNTEITVNYGSSAGTVSVTETNIYASTTQSVAITTPVLLPESETGYALYPNPCQISSTLIIHATDNTPVAIEVSDIKGIAVESHKNQPTNTAVLIGENLKPGIYLIRVYHGNEYAMFKLIKTE
ncbi:MAG: sugar-binding protein [Cytophaga sp.]|uniref:sugar-binding protein n=1 Tax=Cytophaga sp. TaxID=29535 RepID=UPI003F80292B